MLPVFSKPLEAVSADDIHNLIKEQYAEDAVVEFKEQIPHNAGGQDLWYAGGKMEAHGRNKILNEVVAFANAHGGNLLLGIQESNDHPHRAVGISPIPRCEELADVLRKQIRDCIEPHIPIINARGVPIGDDGSGVVIIRVPESGMAPHRLIPNDKCYFRHADRTEAMTMREIQDLTIERMHKSDRLEETFIKRHEHFQKRMANIASGGQQKAVGARVTLAPTARLYAEQVHNNPRLFAESNYFYIQLNDGGIIKTHLPLSSSMDRPILRGARRESDSQDWKLYQELDCSGMIEIGFISQNSQMEKLHLYPSWLLGAVCNGMLMADTFRCGVGAPDVAYELELEVAGTTGIVPIATTERYALHRLLGSPESPLVYPRISVGPGIQAFNGVVEWILRDIWNSCGVPFTLKVTSLSWGTSEFTTQP